MPESVIVGIDGSPQGWSALAWGRGEAARRGAPLRLVHVAASWAAREPEEPRIAGVHRWMRRSAQQVVDEGLAEVRRDRRVPATGAVRYGDPARELLAECAGAAMLVIANRGTGGFTGLLVGSVALHVTAHATCPVIVIRPGVDDGVPGAPGSRDIVVGLDGSAGSLAAAAFAASEAALRGSRLRVVRARANPLAALSRDRSGGEDIAPEAAGTALDAGDEPADRPADRPAERASGIGAGAPDEGAISACLAGLRAAHPGVEIRYEILRGRAAAVLTAASAGAELVVVGSRGRSVLRGIVLGSVSHAVLHHARCPVAVVPSP